MSFKDFLVEGWFSKKPKRLRRFKVTLKIKDSAPSEYGSIDPIYVMATTAKEAENKALERMPVKLRPHLSVDAVSMTM